MQRRPVPALVVSLVVLLVLAAPLFAIRLGFGDNGNREEGDSIREAYDLLAEGFGPGFNGPLLVAAELPNGAGRSGRCSSSSAPTLRRHRRRRLGDAADPERVGQRRHHAGLPDDRRRRTRRRSQLVHHIRDDVVPAVVDGTGVEVHVGGFTAAAVDFADFSAERLPIFIGAVLVLSFLLLMATFRSVLVPLKAVIMNLLSIGAAYGVVVAVFQWGWGARPARRRRARARRVVGADDAVRHRVRAVDGLRGLPAVAHEGGVRPHRRQRRPPSPTGWRRPPGSSPPRPRSCSSSSPASCCRSNVRCSCSASGSPSPSSSTPPSSGSCSSRRRWSSSATATGGCPAGSTGSCPASTSTVPPESDAAVAGRAGAGARRLVPRLPHRGHRWCCRCWLSRAAWRV